MLRKGMRVLPMLGIAIIALLAGAQLAGAQQIKVKPIPSPSGLIRSPSQGSPLLAGADSPDGNKPAAQQAGAAIEQAAGKAEKAENFVSLTAIQGCSVAGQNLMEDPVRVGCGGWI
jgi:hypothetical protein